MTGIEPKDLLDTIALGEVAGRRLDMRAVHERADRIRRRRALGAVLSGAGLAACLAVAVTLTTGSGRCDSRRHRPEGAGRSPRTAT
jgi:ferric-dicitrate binding protein FerR (iron transport regulator)